MFCSGSLSPGRSEGWSGADGAAQHQHTFPARQPRTVRSEAAGHAARQAVCMLLCQLWVCLHTLTQRKMTHTMKVFQARPAGPGPADRAAQADLAFDPEEAFTVMHNITHVQFGH